MATEFPALRKGFLKFGGAAGTPHIQAFANDYRPRAFVGRDKILAQLDEWVDHASKRETSGSTNGLVTAPAGLGKSALLLRWASSRYALAMGLLDALGRLAKYLSQDDAREATELVWRRIGSPSCYPITWWSLLSAMVPLLARAPDAGIAREVLDESYCWTQGEGAAPLCIQSQWMEVWSEDERHEYLRRLSTSRVLNDAASWAELLRDYSQVVSPETREAVVDCVVELALGGIHR